MEMVKFFLALSMFPYCQISILQIAVPKILDNKNYDNNFYGSKLVRLHWL